jgi:hypothetical protein
MNIRKYCCFALCAMLTAARADDTQVNPMAVEIGDSICKGYDDEVVQRLIDRVNAIDHVLPQIPPEELTYLDAQTKYANKVFDDEGGMAFASSHVKSNKLYAELQRRPLYAVWKIREQIGPARYSLNVIQDKSIQHLIFYSRNSEAEKLQRTADALFPLSRFGLSIADYLNTPQAAYISEKDQVLLYSSRDGFSMDLSFYLQCKLAKAIGSKKSK